MSSNHNDTHGGPLQGIRVLDWTMWQFGPVATSMMGDMGADVIKIEALDGDAGRAISRIGTLETALSDGRNAYFETCNRNKRGMAINLKTTAGREIIYELVKKADVFVQNYRKGVADRLGMGYDILHEINPQLIYASGSGYGAEGPDAYLPSFDGCGQARSGLMLSATPFAAEEPTRITQGISDQIGAITLCLGILAALVARGHQGKGQKIEASHLSANMWLQGLGISMLPMSGGSFSAFDRKNAVNPLVNTYKCKDDRWIQLMHLQPERYWDDFTTVMGISQLRDDPKFATMSEQRKHSAELVTILEQRFATKTFEEWDRAFKETGDFIYAKVQSTDELHLDPQVIANDYITPFNHPVLGQIKMCNHPVLYSETPAGIWREAPELGQHTEEILINDLGYTWDDTLTLREQGAIL